MPEITGHFPVYPDPARLAPCVVCTILTDVRAATPGRPDLGEVPLHMLCAAWLVRMYERLRAGEALGAGNLEQLGAFEGRLLELTAGR